MTKIRSLFTIGLIAFAFNITKAAPVYDYFLPFSEMSFGGPGTSGCTGGAYESRVEVTNPITGTVWFNIPESGPITVEDTTPAPYHGVVKILRSDLLESCGSPAATIMGRWNRRFKIVYYVTNGHTSMSAHGLKVTLPRTQLKITSLTWPTQNELSKVGIQFTGPDTNMVYSLLYSQTLENPNWIAHTNVAGSHSPRNLLLPAHMTPDGRPRGFWRAIGTTNTPPAIGNVWLESIDTDIGWPDVICTNNCDGGTVPGFPE